MKHLNKIFLSLAVWTATSLSAHGQLACYVTVPTFTGSYSLSTSVKGAPCLTGSTCTVGESVTGTSKLTLGGFSCGSAFWYGKDTITGTLNDSSVVPCPPPLTPLTTTVVGTGPSAPASTVLNAYSSGSYSYSPPPMMNYKETTSGCDGGASYTGTDFGMYPISPNPNAPVWPVQLSLPPMVESLKASPPISAIVAFAGITLPWKFNFTLEPRYNGDDDCKDAGYSTIGCENQSLGEDLPIAGTGFHLHYESSRTPASGGDGIAIADALMIGGWTLSVHQSYDPATNTLFLGDGSQRNGYQMGTPVGYNGNGLIANQDGSEVYLFSIPAGQHLQTLTPLTGALLYSFGYDKAGQLITITDASGNVTTIQRDSSEHPTAIVAPFGQTTTLAVDSNGFLSQVTDPLGKSTLLTNASQGLLVSRTDPNGNTFTYTYDTEGRLTKDADSIGGYTSLTRTPAASGFGWTVNETTALGRTSSYQTTLALPWVGGGSSTTSIQHKITWPNGLKATSSKSQTGNQLSNAYTLPNGLSVNATNGPDPRFGMQVPIQTSATIKFGTLTSLGSQNRTIAQSDPSNPFSLTMQTDTETVNSRVYTSTFTASGDTYIKKTPVGRSATITLDSLERVASTQIGTLTPSQYTYDTHGRLSSLAQGIRTITFAYDSSGFLASVVDPLTRKTSFTHDADGHLVTTTLPDGRSLAYLYDANGNLTSVTPPGRSAHTFAYNTVNLADTYTPPTVSGAGATTYAYDLDRNLTTIARPDGETMQFNYDGAGRLSSTVTPTETINYSYSSTTGNLSSAATEGGEQIAYTYQGPLLVSSALAGTVAGGVAVTYNNNLWIASVSLNGGTPIPFAYDNDGLVTKAGAFSLRRSAGNGLIAGTSLGSAIDSRLYDPFGDLSSDTASFAGKTLYIEKLTRNADSRVTGKTETIAGTTNTYSYTYDLAGRLTKVTKNVTNVDIYTYDSNSNRTQAVTPAGKITATYDAQDRLLTYGTASFTYTANGELASQTIGTQTTAYQYDVLGNLTAVSLPNGTKITYIIDPGNHRVGKLVNGTLTAGYLYAGNQLVAQLDSSNAIVSQFVYAGSEIVPDYMVSGGVTYRIFTDHLGSPILLVNTSTGAIAEQITYDEFGNVVSDTNPGFQPFGFAAGIYDQDTKFLRFTARDYNPNIGRWTAKDPIRFGGGDSNLYGYVLNDPMNLVDPLGLEDCTCEEKHGGPFDELGESIGRFGAPMDMAKTAVGNVFGQVGASVGEMVMGYVRIVDLVAGGRLLKGSPSLRYHTLWGHVQDGFNTAYNNELTELYGGPCAREKAEREAFLKRLSQPPSGNYNPQQSNPGYAGP